MKQQKNLLEASTSKMARAAVLAATLFGIGNSAHAAIVSCATFVSGAAAKVEDVTGTMTAASDCQYLTPADNSNKASIENINIAGFFGTSTWTLNGANEKLDAASVTGTWAITNADFINNDYIIVFKDGAGTNLMAFLFNESFANGVWASPFASPYVNVNNPKEVSHYTIAQRAGVEVPCNPQTEDCGPREIPEPGGIALMSLGMISAAVAIRRRRSRRA